MYLWQFEQPSKGMKGLQMRAATKRERILFCDALARLPSGECRNFKIKKLVKFEDMWNLLWKRHEFRELTVCVDDGLERPTIDTKGNTAIWTISRKDLWAAAGHFKGVEFHEEWIIPVWVNRARSRLCMWWDVE